MRPVAAAVVGDLPKRINARHRECVVAAQSALEAARDIGTLLLQAKAIAGHGQWLSWIEKNLEFGERTARGYMRISTNWAELSNRQPVADLGIKPALKLLAEPRAEESPGANRLARLTDDELAAEAIKSREDAEEADRIETDSYARLRALGWSEQKIAKACETDVARVKMLRPRVSPRLLPSPGETIGCEHGTRRAYVAQSLTNPGYYFVLVESAAVAATNGADAIMASDYTKKPIRPEYIAFALVNCGWTCFTEDEWKESDFPTERFIANLLTQPDPNASDGENAWNRKVGEMRLRVLDDGTR